MTDAMQPARDKPPDLEAAKHLLSVARERLTNQEHAWNAHRTKAGFILAAIAASLSASFSLVRQSEGGGINVLLTLVILGAGGTSIATIWPRRMKPGINLTQMIAPKWLSSETECVMSLLVHYNAAIEANEGVLGEVARLSAIALGCLAAALAMLVLLGVTAAG